MALIGVLVLGLLIGAALGYLFGLGMTLRILRDIRDRMPEEAFAARAAIADVLERFGA